MNRRGGRVVVIGGGVIGCTVAWRLAARGVAVTLLERDEPGRAASAAAAGMLSPLAEAGEAGPFLALGIRSLEQYPGFVERVEAESGMEVGYRRDGRLDVAFTEAAAAELVHRRAYMREAGFDGRVMDAAELRRNEPALAPDALLGLVTEFDHSVDNERLGRALWLAAGRAGVDMRTAAEVDGVVTDGPAGRVTGVRLASGVVVAAATVVVAAGAWSGRLRLPRPIPVRPVRGQIVVLRPEAAVLTRVTLGPGCYLVPRPDGRLLVGATAEEAGFAVHATAGAARGLIEAAVRLVPALGAAPIDGFQVGLRPTTPDGLPILGPDPEAGGLFHATGHFRNGILLAPETAELLTAAILDDRPIDDAFAPVRFGA